MWPTKNEEIQAVAQQTEERGGGDKFKVKLCECKHCMFGASSFCIFQFFPLSVMTGPALCSYTVIIYNTGVCVWVCVC